MSDDKPSIAALQAAQVRDTFSDEGMLIDAAPVLLEIAAAVKTLQAEGWDFRSATMDVLLAALAKVRP